MENSVFTPETAKIILEKIKGDGYSIAGFCRVNKINRDSFYDFIKGFRGQSDRPSPKFDHVFKVLSDKGYLPTGDRGR